MYSSLRSSGIGGMPTTVGTDFVRFPNVSHAAVPPAPTEIAVAMVASFNTERSDLAVPLPDQQVARHRHRDRPRSRHLGRSRVKYRVAH
jgi:hypothetical protein